MSAITPLAPVIMVGLFGLALLVTMSATGLLLLLISARAQGLWPPEQPSLDAGESDLPSPLPPPFIRDGG